MSKFDRYYRKLLLTKFFVKGWGNPENLKRLFEARKIISNRATCSKLVDNTYPVHIDKDEVVNDVRLVEGHFLSPFTKYLPGIMPKEVETARFQMVLPRAWKGPTRPMCLQLAGTGDHGFWRRRTLLARPLLKESGIASILLENPYYGSRKPKTQLRSSLHNVSDLFVMGGALVLESLVLLHWCEKNGYGPLGLTGISMGGHMASLAATNWSKPISLVPCLSWSTASVVFTQGVMSGAIPWKLLEAQYLADDIFKDEISHMVYSPEDHRNHAFKEGQRFAQDCSANSDEIQKTFNARSSFNPVDNLEGELSRGHPRASGVISMTNFNRDSMENNCAHTDTGVASSNPVVTATTDSVTTRSYSTVRKFLPKSLLPLGKDRKSAKAASKEELQKVAYSFMRGVMDECTHLANFSVPVDPELIVIVAAKSDAYYPRAEVLGLDSIWPGAEVRYINSGHITAFLFKQDVFRKAIADSFARQTEKYWK